MNNNIPSNSNDVFYRCVEDSSEAIMITNHSGNLVYVNPAWNKIYGYSKNEALGKSPKIIQSGMHTAEFYAGMWNSIRNPSIGFWKGEVINKSKTGKLCHVLLTITPYKSQSGEIEGYMGVALDITQKKNLEAQVVHQDRLATIGMLASGLAHEVGTPMGVIRGRAEMLLMQTNQENVKKNLEVIISQIDRISKLIRSLLRVSRSTSDVRLEKIFPHEIAYEIGSLIEKDIKQVQFNYINKIPEKLGVKADFSRLEQVVLNLVVNSVYAIKKSIEKGRKNSHFILFEAEEMGDFISIRISDSGCGISTENQKKLFKPFFTTKQIGEGTGLGLMIVAQLIQEMNGEISAESKVDVGTTFSIRLPRA